jgi:hypothetical protein
MGVMGQQPHNSLVIFQASARMRQNQWYQPKRDTQILIIASDIQKSEINVIDSLKADPHLKRQTIMSMVGIQGIEIMPYLSKPLRPTKTGPPSEATNSWSLERFLKLSREQKGDETGIPLACHSS